MTMPQLVIDVGAEALRPLVHCVTELASGHRTNLHVMTRARRDNLEYEQCTLTLEQASARLEAGEFVSIQAELEGNHPDGVATMLLFAPGFDGDAPVLWTMTIEARTKEYERLVGLLTGIPGVEHVAVSIEDGIDYPSERFTAETFPWASPGLVTASIRAGVSAERWVTRAGRAFYDPRRVRR